MIFRIWQSLIKNIVIIPITIELKKDIDDALQLIKKKLEKTPQVRKSVTESQKNGNNINKKGGGIKHG